MTIFEQDNYENAVLGFSNNFYFLYIFLSSLME